VITLRAQSNTAVAQAFSRRQPSAG
jgi:hypothetical protein